MDQTPGHLVTDGRETRSKIRDTDNLYNLWFVMFYLRYEMYN